MLGHLEQSILTSPAICPRSFCLLFLSVVSAFLPHREPNKATTVLKALLVVTGCAFAVGAGAAGNLDRAGFRGVRET